MYVTYYMKIVKQKKSLCVRERENNNSLRKITREREEKERRKKKRDRVPSLIPVAEDRQNPYLIILDQACFFCELTNNVSFCAPYDIVPWQSTFHDPKKIMALISIQYVCDILYEDCLKKKLMLFTDTRCHV